MNAKITEYVALLGAIDADAYAAGTYTTGWVKKDRFNRFAALVAAGDLGASATLDAKIEQAKDSSGTGVKDVTGKAITQLTQAGTDSNKQAWINFEGSDLDGDNDFTHCRLSITVGVAASDAAGYLFGGDAYYGPAQDHDATTVDEII